MVDLKSDTASSSNGSSEESWQPCESEYSGSESVERQSTKADISEEKDVDSSSAKRIKVPNDSKDGNQDTSKG